MAAIRVDQSHCNYYLKQRLEQGWLVVFADPGRSSRGGVGAQGAALAIFEEAGLHIPDLVAIRDDIALIVEIDSSISRSLPSLHSYVKHADYILESMRERPLLGSPSRLWVGFCRTGLVRGAQTYLDGLMAEHPVLALAAAFSEPREPLIRYRTELMSD